jgi:hypothetical protein
VENGQAHRTPIRVGIRDDKFVQVLKQQVSSREEPSWVDFAGEETIVENQSSVLADGQAVTVSTGNK